MKRRPNIPSGVSRSSYISPITYLSSHLSIPKHTPSGPDRMLIARVNGYSVTFTDGDRTFSFTTTLLHTTAMTFVGGGHTFRTTKTVSRAKYAPRPCSYFTTTVIAPTTITDGNYTTTVYKIITTTATIFESKSTTITTTVAQNTTCVTDGVTVGLADCGVLDFTGKPWEGFTAISVLVGMLVVCWSGSYPMRSFCPSAGPGEG